MVVLMRGGITHPDSLVRYVNPLRPLLTLLWRVAFLFLISHIGLPATAAQGADTVEERLNAAQANFLDGDCQRALEILDPLLQGADLSPAHQSSALELKAKCLIRSNAGEEALRAFFCDVVKHRYLWRPNELDFAEDVLRLFRLSEAECRQTSPAAPPTSPDGVGKNHTSVLREGERLLDTGQCADVVALMRQSLDSGPEWPIDEWIHGMDLQARGLACVGRLGEARSAYLQLLRRDGSWRPIEATATTQETVCFRKALGEFQGRRRFPWKYVAVGGGIGGIVTWLLVQHPSTESGEITISVPLH